MGVVYVCVQVGKCTCGDCVMMSIQYNTIVNWMHIMCLQCVSTCVCMYVQYVSVYLCMCVRVVCV